MNKSQFVESLPYLLVQNIQSVLMADANTSKTTRATAKAQFTRSEKKLRDSLVTGEEADKVPVTTIKRRFEDVMEKWRRAQDTHDAYIAALGNDTDMTTE